MLKAGGATCSKPLLSTIFEHDKKQFQCVLTEKDISWTPHTENALPGMSIPLCEVLAIKAETTPKPAGIQNHRSNEMEMQPCKGIAIHYMKRLKNQKWKPNKLVFYGQVGMACKEWLRLGNEMLQALKRPKKLLVFINPVGGRKMAKKIYKDKVAPLFDLVGIAHEVIVTEFANHAYEYLLNEDIQKYDGIISVGGDGMVSELINGMLRRHHKMCNIPEDSMGDHHTEIASSKPIQCLGIIPAGSTDTIAFCTSGINDPTTCALHIIVGDQIAVDVCSVWSGGKFFKYFISMAGYGFLGDVMQESERLRWMGPRRYEVAGFKTFLSNRVYCGEVMYVPALDGSSPLPMQSTRCFSGCTRCAAESEDETKPALHTGEQWESATGSFISIVGANLTCRCAKAVSGISPHAHVGDGCMDLILIRKTSRTQYFKQMHSMAYKGDPFSFNFVEAIRVKEFKFKLHNAAAESSMAINGQIENVNQTDSPRNGVSIGTWNVDGELVNDAWLHFRTHRQLINVFGRGVEEIEETAGCKPFRRKHQIDESSL